MYGPCKDTFFKPAEDFSMCPTTLRFFQKAFNVIGQIICRSFNGKIGRNINPRMFLSAIIYHVAILAFVKFLIHRFDLAEQRGPYSSIYAVVLV